MLIVSDASPINILVLLGQVEILGRLFQSVIIPTSVAEEMSRPATPGPVKEWVAKPPPWFSIRTPTLAEPATRSPHRGERDALHLAQELKADAILLDEEKPRRQATQLGLRVIGTVGVLEPAANKGYIKDLETVYDQLRKTNFYVGAEILSNSVARHNAFLKSREQGN